MGRERLHHVATADWRVILQDAQGAIVPTGVATNTRREVYGTPVVPGGLSLVSVPLETPFPALMRIGVLPGGGPGGTDAPLVPSAMPTAAATAARLVAPPAAQRTEEPMAWVPLVPASRLAAAGTQPAVFPPVIPEALVVGQTDRPDPLGLLHRSGLTRW